MGHLQKAKQVIIIKFIVHKFIVCKNDKSKAQPTLHKIYSITNALVTDIHLIELPNTLNTHLIHLISFNTSDTS